MSATTGSSSVGNQAANLMSPSLNKIGLAIAKERRVPPLLPVSISSGEAMKKQSISQQANGAEPVRIWKARNFIEQHWAEELSLGKVARATNTSANYFSEKFKEATGTTFVKYVARKRFEKAAALLRDADLRVSEIAFAVGFQSLSQFNRVFKKLAGKSPRDYRAAARGEKANS
jgi:AraC-like DNA-binding protein